MPQKQIPIDELLGQKPAPTQVAPTPIAPQNVQVGGPKSIPVDQLFGMPAQHQVTPEADAAFQREEAAGAKQLRRTVVPPLAAIAGGLVGGLPGAAALGGVAASANAAEDVQDSGEKLSPAEAIRRGIMTGGKNALINYGAGKVMSAIPNQGPIQDRLWRALMGATMGNVIKTGEQAFSGEPQEPSESPGLDFLKDTGLNFGTDLLLSGVAKGANRLVNGKTPAPTGTTLKQEADLTRGQLARGGREDQFRDSSGVDKPVEPVKPHSQETYGKAVNQTVRSNRNASESNEARFFNLFRDKYAEPASAEFEGVTGFNVEHLPDGTQHIVPTGTRPIKITGAIPTANSTTLATEALKQVDQWMTGDTYGQLPVEMKPKFVEIRSLLKKLADGQTVLHDGEVKKVPIIDWETAKEIRTQIRTGSGSKLIKDYPDKMFDDIQKALGDDINFAVGKLWPNGPDALQTLELANLATETQKQTFNKKVLNRISGPNDRTGSKDLRVDPDPEKVLKGSFTDPSEAARIAAAVGPEDRHLLSRAYFDGHLMKKAFGDNYSKFNPDFIINELEGLDSVGRKYMTAAERNNVLRFAKAAKASGFISENGTQAEQDASRAINMWKDRAILHIGAGAARAIGIPGVSSGVKLVIGIKELMEATKESKPLTDIASRLIKIDPKTAEANTGMKLLLKSLSGTTVMLLNQDGEEKKYVVGQRPQ